MSYQLLIADDHLLFRDALMMALQQGDLSDSTIALASTLEETLTVLEQRQDLDCDVHILCAGHGSLRSGRRRSGHAAERAIDSVPAQPRPG